MKIRGSSPFRQVGGAKSAKTKKSGFASKVESAAATATADPVAAVEEVDTPVMDIMQKASARYQAGDDSLEEATKGVVEAVILESFGRRQITPEQVKEISAAVFQSVSHDSTLQARLERILKEIAAKG